MGKNIFSKILIGSGAALLCASPFTAFGNAATPPTTIVENIETPTDDLLTFEEEEQEEVVVKEEIYVWYADNQKYTHTEWYPPTVYVYLGNDGYRVTIDWEYSSTIETETNIEHWYTPSSWKTVWYDDLNGGN